MYRTAVCINGESNMSKNGINCYQLFNQAATR